MCLIAWRWQPDAAEPLVVLSNRDEFFNRPARALHRWPDVLIWAGQDELAGGTWLGVGEAGRLAAITNYRTTQATNELAQSRGHLVRDFLCASHSAADYAAHVAQNASAYNPFNLWLFDGQRMAGVQGRLGKAEVVALSPGYGSVSNADFHSDWPKQVQLQSQLRAHFESSDAEDDTLLDLLRNTQTAPVHQLPHTGMAPDKELALSAMFVRLPGYGTRTSTLVRYSADEVTMKERSFDAQAQLSACVVEVRVPRAPHAHRAHQT